MLIQIQTSALVHLAGGSYLQRIRFSIRKRTHSRIFHITSMHAVEVAHWSLVHKRAQIRHDKDVGLWIIRCWRAATQLVGSFDTSRGELDRSGFDLVYRRLLATMTVSWDDETFRAIADELWKKDSEAFNTLDQDRFGCSIFAFSEMWVDQVDTPEYTRVLRLIHSILRNGYNKSVTSSSNPTSLGAFLDALCRERELASERLCIGKSLPFDLERYTSVFGEEAPRVSLPKRKLHDANRRHRHSMIAASSIDTCLLAMGAPVLRPRSCSAIIRVDESLQSHATRSEPFTRSLGSLPPSRFRERSTQCGGEGFSSTCAISLQRSVCSIASFESN